jgi:hypothetical protein
MDLTTRVSMMMVTIAASAALVCGCGPSYNLKTPENAINSAFEALKRKDVDFYIKVNECDYELDKESMSRRMNGKNSFDAQFIEYTHGIPLSKCYVKIMNMGPTMPVGRKDSKYSQEAEITFGIFEKSTDRLLYQDGCVVRQKLDGEWRVNDEML